VGWSDLIRRRHPRVKTTAVEVAAALAEAIVESTNVPQGRLGDEGFAWTDPALFRISLPICGPSPPSHRDVSPPCWTSYAFTSANPLHSRARTTAAI